MSDAGEAAVDDGNLEDEDEYVDERAEPRDGEANGVGGTKAPRTQRPKKVPRGTLETAVGLATTMWGTAGSGSESAEAIARLFGHETTNSSSFRNKLALMRIGGLVEGSDSLKLTDIGLDIIRDDDPARQIEARRRAFHQPQAFKKLLEAYNGRALPSEGDLATKCRFDFNLTEEAALEVSRVLAASLPYAGLMDDDGIVHQSGVSSAGTPGPDYGSDELDGHRVDESDGGRGEELDSDQLEAPAHPGALGERSSSSGSENSRSMVEPHSENPTIETPDGTSRSSHRDGGTAEVERRGQRSGPTVEIMVTLNGYSGAEVVEILRTVGYRNAQS